MVILIVVNVMVYFAVHLLLVILVCPHLLELGQYIVIILDLVQMELLLAVGVKKDTISWGELE
jgi:hypothetical protein